MVLEQDVYTQHAELVNAWHLQLDSALCHDVEAGLNHEWLVTNGLGGYAAGSIVGAATSCYHGLLVASLHPPVERTVLVTKIDEEATLPGGEVLKLGVNEHLDGTLNPQGYRYLFSISLDGDIPCFVYRLTESLTLEKRIWMEYGQNTTYVQYALHGSFTDDDNNFQNPDGRHPSLTLTLSPLCLSRDYNSTTRGSDDWHFLVDAHAHHCCIRATANAPSYQLIADPSTTFTPTGLWYWQLLHRRDQERGLAGSEDAYQPGLFHLSLIPGMRKTLVLSAEPLLSSDFGGSYHEAAASQALMRHQRRIHQILAMADRSIDNLQISDPVHARLVIAADQFIVARPDYATVARQAPRFSPDRKTIIAGYAWFTDWGRDSMISLPGLLLSTGRYSEARGLLKAFVSFMHQGFIPNRFSESGDVLVYNSVDATLWLFHALDRYLKQTADWTLLKELFPALQESIQWHIKGTSYGIRVDVQDGLLCADMPGVALTWMDAKIDDWLATPRRGKPVEVNALWYCALTAIEAWAVRLSIDATPYSQLRSQVQQHFAARFWFAEGGYLYDVVDVDGHAGQNDTSLRPNQLFAASLTHELLSDAQTATLFQKVTNHLLTPAGLRSLSPTDPAYHASFQGDRRQRYSAYHQGAVWQWLIGPYIDVYLSVHRDSDRSALLPLLLPFVQQLWDTCLGTLSEVAEPEPPFSSRGCFAQAWSVAELLRCWLLLVG